MAILQGILALGLLIGFFVGIVYFINKLLDLISDKKEDKPEIIETTHSGQWLINQIGLSDYIQDDGKFVEYPPRYVLEYYYHHDCIRGISMTMKAYRNIYESIGYELILQTDRPLKDITNLDEEITYRIIVLDKDKKDVIKLMDEKQKILNDIEEAQRKLDEARKKLDEYNTGYKRWKPENDETYFYVISNGVVGQDRYNKEFATDERRYNFYNCFKTQEEAKQEADKIFVRRQLEDIAKRLNKGEKIDWDNNEQSKYCIGLHCNNPVIYFVFTRKNQGTVYCLSSNFLDVAKREIGEDRLIKYLGGEAK